MDAASVRYDRRMPLIRCPKCGQAYDVPGSVSVHLANAIATCHCGEWIAGSKAAVLARLMKPDEIKEIDLQPYRVDESAAATAAAAAAVSAPAPAPAATGPHSVRVVARSTEGLVNHVFTLTKHPLWIGRTGCHINLDAPDLDIKHCSIYLEGNQLMLRDCDSHMGTFLDGQRIGEVPLPEGEHVLRVGGALVTVETTYDPGTEVVPVVKTEKVAPVSDAQLATRAVAAVAAPAAPKRSVLVCIEGPLDGQEFEIPATGLIVGREGHVRVPDEYLSRKHFEVVPDAEGIMRVRDLGSRNGTFLNTLPASNSKVQGGDEIRAGNNRFRIEQRP
jgi:pSer/pThr/pTyr-binding forkhead associated (FHA) protein